MTAMSVPEVLRRAEQVIGERGWCQGDYSDLDGRVCAEGSINVALWGSPWPHEAPGDDDSELAATAVKALGAHVGEYPTGWNDADERTEAQVCAALLAAAERAEEQP